MEGDAVLEDGSHDVVLVPRRLQVGAGGAGDQHAAEGRSRDRAHTEELRMNIE